MILPFVVLHVAEQQFWGTQDLRHVWSVFTYSVRSSGILFFHFEMDSHSFSPMHCWQECSEEATHNSDEKQGPRKEARKALLGATCANVLRLQLANIPCSKRKPSGLDVVT